MAAVNARRLEYGLKLSRGGRGRPPLASPCRPVPPGGLLALLPFRSPRRSGEALLLFRLRRLCARRLSSGEAERGGDLAVLRRGTGDSSLRLRGGGLGDLDLFVDTVETEVDEAEDGDRERLPLRLFSRPLFASI